MNSTTRRGACGRVVLAIAASTAAVTATAVPAQAAPAASFDAPVSYATGIYPWGITAGDINGDGKRDVIIANVEYRQVGSVTVYVNNGDGTFGSRSDYRLDTSPFETVLADFNRDGKVDMAVARGIDIGQAAVTVFPGNGDGTFGTPTHYTVGDAPQSIATGDMNGDGAPDLVTGNWLDETVSVLLNN